MCTIHFGSGSEFLTLRIHGRVKPDSASYWDANWLHCSAEVSAGAFSGNVEWQLRNEDLARFMNAIESLPRRVGEAVLDTGDGWLDVRVIRDDQGQIQALCQIEDQQVGGKALECRLFLDETVIPQIHAELREVLERFPVIRDG